MISVHASTGSASKSGLYGWLEKQVKAYFIPLLVLVLAGYLIQMASPLRLNNDNSRLLTMADSYLDIGIFTVPGLQTYFPTGYPWLIVFLNKLELASPATFVFTNVLFLSIGLVALFGIVNKIRPNLAVSPYLVCLFAALNMLLIKYSALPQPEALYTALSLLAIRCSLEINGGMKRRFLFWLVLALLTLSAISLKTFGVSLLPVVFLGLYPLFTDRPLNLSTTRIKGRTSAVLFLIFLLAIGTIYYVAVDTIYWNYLRLGYILDPAQLTEHIVKKTTTFFQLAVNLPTSLASAVPQPLVTTIGLVYILMIGFGFFKTRRHIGILEIYVLTATALLFVWPFFQARFWMPISPLLFIYALAGFTNADNTGAARFLNATRIGWLALYGSIGCASLAYSISLTASGNQFPARYGGGVGGLSYVYSAAFNGHCPAPVSRLDYLSFDLLQRYEPLAVAPHEKCKVGP